MARRLLARDWISHLLYSDLDPELHGFTLRLHKGLAKSSQLVPELSVCSRVETDSNWPVSLLTRVHR